jgi:YfiH family protein
MFASSGGASRSPFAGLNLSFGVGDDSDAVTLNRQQVKKHFDLQYLVSARQVHGKRIIIAEDIKQDTEFADCDAIISSQPGIGLLIQQADCQAVLLHDPVQNIIAAVHSGWRGSVLNITGKTVAAMLNHYNTNAADLRAVISPSLGPCCAEFINYRQELPESFHDRQVRPGYFDFPAITRSQLTDAGLVRKNIETAGICTKCSRDFFSYRRAVREGNGITGRNGSVISLPQETPF